MINITTGREAKQYGLLGGLNESWAKKATRAAEWDVPIPAYLEKTYWWAYVRPSAIAFFDHEWIVNLILLGNMVKLRDKALNALGPSIQGRTLQIASVYGDFSPRLAQRIAKGGLLDIIDVVPAQLQNLRRKLPPRAPVRLIQSDSTSLKFSDAEYDQVLMFFLLHEMPAQVRERTLSEALRVLKPGGTLVIVDFHKPSPFNVLRYLYPLMFKLLEPFALDIWRDDIEDWLPEGFVPASLTKETMSGGLYQKIVIVKPGANVRTRSHFSPTGPA
jgi:ubiquinone/menaquinone biosynthesis C-methylase UbiE